MARASRVLPVPGAPTISTPRGMVAPRSRNFSGLRRNSTSSHTSSLASLMPATSLNVTLFLSGEMRRARLLPKLMAPRAPPLCARDMKNRITRMSTMGSRFSRMPPQEPDSRLNFVSGPRSCLTRSPWNSRVKGTSMRSKRCLSTEASPVAAGQMRVTICPTSTFWLPSSARMMPSFPPAMRPSRARRLNSGTESFWAPSGMRETFFPSSVRYGLSTTL